MTLRLLLTVKIIVLGLLFVACGGRTEPNPAPEPIVAVISPSAATPTPITTSTVTPSPTDTVTATPTATPTRTATPSPTPTATATSTASPTPTSVPSAKFEVKSLIVAPEKPLAGDEITVEAQVTNIGNAPGSFQAEFKVDGKVVDTKEVTVAAGGQQPVSFVYALDTAGSLDLEIGAADTTVQVLKPAKLRVKSLSVTPLVFPNEIAIVEAEVANIGEVEGNLLASLEVDGVEQDNKPLTLGPGATASVTFTIVRNSPGSYQISMGDLLTTLTVPELTTYTDETFLYSISYPSDWAVVTDDTATGAVVIGSESQGLYEVKARPPVHAFANRTAP